MIKPDLEALAEAAARDQARYNVVFTLVLAAALVARRDQRS